MDVVVDRHLMMSQDEKNIEKKRTPQRRGANVSTREKTVILATATYETNLQSPIASPPRYHKPNRNTREK
jgi:hypothetical protein